MITAQFIKSISSRALMPYVLATAKLTSADAAMAMAYTTAPNAIETRLYHLTFFFLLARKTVTPIAMRAATKEKSNDSATGLTLIKFAFSEVGAVIVNESWPVFCAFWFDHPWNIAQLPWSMLLVTVMVSFVRAPLRTQLVAGFNEVKLSATGGLAVRVTVAVNGSYTPAAFIVMVAVGFADSELPVQASNALWTESATDTAFWVTENIAFEPALYHPVPLVDAIGEDTVR
jgi:hypothetical protein